MIDSGSIIVFVIVTIVTFVFLNFLFGKYEYTFLLNKEKKEWNGGRCSICSQKWRKIDFNTYECECRQITINTEADNENYH